MSLCQCGCGGEAGTEQTVISAWERGAVPTPPELLEVLSQRIEGVTA